MANARAQTGLLATVGWLRLLGVVVLLCGQGSPLHAQAPLIESDLGGYALHLESRGGALTWESNELKVFVLPAGGEVRQGPVRMAAAGLVLWLDKELSCRPDVQAATVRIYAEGAGEPGKEAASPVRLVEKSRTLEASVICLQLRSSVGFAWECRTAPVEDLQTLPLYRRAEVAIQRAQINFVLETLPETPEGPPRETLVRALTAEEIHFFTEEDEGRVTAVYLGDVQGAYGNLEVNADVAVLWYEEAAESYEMYARGNVMLRRKPGVAVPGLAEETRRILGRFETIRADEIYINPGRERGLATRTELRAEAPELGPDEVYVVSGREAYILDSRNLLIREGSITTCPFGHPHYQFTGERVRVLHEDPSLFVTGWNVNLRVGREEHAALRLPFLAMDLSRREGFLLASVALGASGKFGPFMKTRWRPTHLGLQADWIRDWLVHLDYYGARGPGVGTDLEYEFGGPAGPTHAGTFTAYYVHDSGDEDDTGLPVPQTERGRLWLRHRAEWDERWRTDMELYWLSDSAFLNEYFEKEFEGQKAPENYIFTRYREGNFWAGLLFKMRLNRFLTQLEERPSAELQWVGVPIGPLVYDASLEAGLYDLEVSNELPLPDPPSLVRVHTEHRLSAPFSVGFVRVDPFVRGVATWASKGAMSGGSYTGPHSRVGVGGGVRASANFARSYNVRNELFALNRLRHVVTPYAEFETLSFVSGESADFIQMGGLDPWPMGGRGPRVPADRIDAMFEGEQVRVGVRQRLQTKRPRGESMRTVDWIEMDAAYVARSDDPLGMGGDDDYVDIDFDWRARPGLTIFSHDSRLSLEGGTSVFNLGAQVDLRGDRRLAVSYHYISDLSSAIIATFTGRLSDRYALKVVEKFDLSSGGGGSENMETEVVLRRFFHKWIFDLGVRYAGDTNDFAVLIGFSPVGLEFWEW